MSIAGIIPDWIRKYEIKSLLNTPCGGHDCAEFLRYGVEKVLGVNLQSSSDANHVAGDLRNWKPDGEWDAAYINCIFCGQLYGPDGQPAMDYVQLAKNYASWPVKYIIVYDTAYEYDWAPHFLDAGWEVIERGQAESSPTRVEIWGHAG